MQVIATGNLREFLVENLPKYNDPVIFIHTNFIPGCPACNSHATVYYVNFTERESLDGVKDLIEITEHKFPIQIFIMMATVNKIPDKFILGTSESNGKLKIAIKKILYE